jgi:UrcA family protein
MTAPKKCASSSLAAGMVLALSVATSGVAAAKDVTVVAAPQEGSLSERVQYADLDLASPAGVELLGTRVGSAVTRVCSPLDQRSTFSEHGACKSFAWNGARPQMDRAVVRARELASTGMTAIAPVAILIAVPSR